MKFVGAHWYQAQKKLLFCYINQLFSDEASGIKYFVYHCFSFKKISKTKSFSIYKNVGRSKNVQIGFVTPSDHCAVQCGFKKIQLFLGHPVEQKGWPNDIALQYYELGVVYYSGENNHVPIDLFSNNYWWYHRSEF